LDFYRCGEHLLKCKKQFSNKLGKHELNVKNLAQKTKQKN